MQSAPGGTLLVYNGEVYNHPELRAELARDGDASRRRATPRSCCALLERDGLAALDRLNGQFAFAWWEPRAAPADAGARPLRRAPAALGAARRRQRSSSARRPRRCSPPARSRAEPDLGGIDEVFTLWAPRAPRTAFRGVASCRPAACSSGRAGGSSASARWWEPELRAARRQTAPSDLDELLRDSVRLRLRADVPVGTYLSGGLDSSLITALAQQASDHELRTFSVAFHDPHYDERAYQQRGRRARSAPATTSSTSGRGRSPARSRDVVWHAETPADPHRARAAVPARPGDARAGHHGRRDGRGRRRAVLGLRPLQGGRRCATLPRATPERRGGAARPALPVLRRAGAARRGARLAALLPRGRPRSTTRSSRTRPRVAATAGVKAFYRPEAPPRRWPASDPLERLRADAAARRSARWSRARARRLPRGDDAARAATCSPRRATASAMAHGVEGRYPFLDHRVFEHSVAPAARAQARAGLREKVALRELAARCCRPTIAARTKQPYRAPEVAPFFGERRAGVGRGACSRPGALDAAGDLRPSARRGARAPLPRGPGDRLPRGHGARRRAVDAGLARAVLRAGRRRLPARDAASRGCLDRKRVDQTEEDRHGADRRDALRDGDARLHRGELPLHAPGHRAAATTTSSWSWA